MADVAVTATLPAVTIKNLVAAQSNNAQAVFFPTDGTVWLRATAATTTVKVSVLAWKLAEVSR